MARCVNSKIFLEKKLVVDSKPFIKIIDFFSGLLKVESSLLFKS